MLHPAVPPAVALLAGAAGGCLWSWPAGRAGACLLVAVLGTSLVAFLAGCRRLSLAATLAGFALAGFLTASGAMEAAQHPPLERQVQAEGAPVEMEGLVREDAAPGRNSVGLTLDVTSVCRGARAAETSGGVTVNVNGAVARTMSDGWTAGRRVRITAALREPAGYGDPGVPPRDVALRRRGTRFVGTVKSGALVEVVEPGSRWAEQAASARRFARGAVERTVGRFSRESAAIVTAILIGDRVGLDEEVQRRLQEAGTYHVIAISGGNIAILAGLLVGLFRAAGVRSRWALAVVMAALAWYRALVGGGASVDRATLMACTYLAAEMADHRGAPLNALAVSAALIVSLAPLSILDPGFMLTFGATLGILVGGGWLGPRLPRSRLLAAPARLFLASLSAELALLPVSASAFSRVTFAGLALNFVAIPLMSVAQIAGMAALAAVPFSGALGSAAGFIAHLGAAGLVASARLVDVVPWLAWRVPPPAFCACACYYAGGAVLLALLVDEARAPSALAGRLARWPGARRPVAAAAAVLLAGSALWIVVSPAGRLRGATATGRLQVAFLDVGQADSIAVRFPDASTMLVDAGGSWMGAFDVGGRVIMPALWALDIYGLDVLAVSHGDPDHVGGAAALVRDLRVGEIWEGLPVPRDPLLAALHEVAARRGTRLTTVLAGTRREIGGVAVRLWHPPPADWERQKVRNDDSLVIELAWRNVSIVLPGDIGEAVERQLAGRIPPAPLRILKVPHHGSATSSSPAFLEAVRPAVAVFTAAGSTPSPALQAVMARYRGAGCATLLRTGADGAVLLDTDGETVNIRTWRGKTVRLSADTKGTKGYGGRED